MSTISLHLPDSLHEQVMEVARRDGISVDQFFASAIAEKLAALQSHDYLDQRARRSSRAAFERALAKVPHGPPVPGDELE